MARDIYKHFSESQRVCGECNAENYGKTYPIVASVLLFNETLCELLEEIKLLRDKLPDQRERLTAAALNGFIAIDGREGISIEAVKIADKLINKLITG